jgi:enoyl-CoA hydratase/carnithine racemase
MEYKTVTVTKEDHIVSLTLSGPSVNWLSRDPAGELAETCLAINREDDVYVVVLSGLEKVSHDGNRVEYEDIKSPAGSVADIECPVIAVINGDTMGEGLEIALSCDIRLASDTARLGLTQVSQGLIPVDGGTQRLPRIVGRGKALELLLTAATINAKEALEIGLVSRVVPSEKLMSESGELAKIIAAKGPVALKYLKEAVNKGVEMTLEQGLRLEADLYFLLHTTADRSEGIRAFLGKKTPQFKGQ